MPTNKTPHYNLSQWERDDRILMEDFNEDNAKIDAALAELAAADAEETQARVALAGLVERKGSCSVGFFSYSGNGQFGPSSPTVISFSRRPAAFFVIADSTIAAVWGSAGSVNYKSGTSAVSVSWSGSSARLTTNNGLANWQLNAQNVTYNVLALYNMS